MRLFKIKFLLVNSYILFNILHAVPIITLSDLQKIKPIKITECTKFNQQFEISQTFGEYLYYSDKGFMRHNNYYAISTSGSIYSFSHVSRPTILYTI